MNNKKSFFRKINKLFLISISFVFLTSVVLVSCQKEDDLENEKIEVSDYESTQIKKHKKEIVVTDASGENQAFYVIYADDENLLSEYLAANEFSLEINQEIEQNNVGEKKALKSNIEGIDFNEEPKIIVDLIMTNLQDNVSNYSLKIDRNQLKSSNSYILGYPVGYSTDANFIGVVHRGRGYDLGVQFRYKLNNWYSMSWHTYTAPNGDSFFMLYASTAQYYARLDESWNVKKRMAVVYPHLYQNSTNYAVAYNRDNFRGHSCRIGTYDYNNYGECYVGTAPTGTSAFVWGGNFYYTPINGNQCPRAGSWFDGANCFVMNIPAGCEPYTWQRNWLVKSEKLN